MPQNVIPAEVEPSPNQAHQAALALQRLGFRVLHIGRTISVQGPESLWGAIFNVSFEPQTKRVMEEVEGSEVTYLKALRENMRIPPDLQNLIVDVMFVEPPEFY